MSRLSPTAAHSTATFRQGYYHIAPQSWGRDFNQDKNVELVPGQQVYVKIVSLESWAVSVSGSRTIARDTFYAWLILPEVAQVEMAGDRSSIWQSRARDRRPRSWGTPHATSEILQVQHLAVIIVGKNFGVPAPIDDRVEHPFGLLLG